MIIKILLLICFFVQSVGGAFVWKSLLTQRFSSLVTCLLGGLVGVISFVLDFFTQGNIFAKSILSIAAFLIITNLAFTDKLLKKAVVICGWAVALFSLEIILVLIYEKLLGFVITTDSPFGIERLGIVITSTCFYVFVFWLFCMFVKRKEKVCLGPLTTSLVSSVFISQGITLWACIVTFWTQDILPSIVIMSFGVAVSLASNFFAAKAAEDARQKKDAGDKLEIDEQIHNNKIAALEIVEQSEKQLAKTRHDIQGHIFTMKMLAKEGQNEELLSYIEDLKI